MNEKKNTRIAVIGLTIVVALVGWYIYTDTKTKSADSGAQSGETTKADETENTGRADEQSSTEIDTSPTTIQFGGTNLPPTPDLNRLVISQTITGDVRTILSTKIASTSAALKKDSTLFELWIDLGLQRKMGGDYEGARLAWEYASALSPTNILSFINLGDLYGYYLHDNAKAEQNFLSAIKNAPSEVSTYFRTADFYKDVLKDVAKARAIVQKGIDANPSSQELKDLLASLK